MLVEVKFHVRDKNNIFKIPYFERLSHEATGNIDISVWRYIFRHAESLLEDDVPKKMAKTT
jgi:hypothetical protein